MRPRAEAAAEAIVASPSDNSGTSNGSDCGSRRQPSESTNPALTGPVVLAAASRKAAPASGQGIASRAYRAAWDVRSSPKRAASAGTERTVPMILSF